MNVKRVIAIVISVALDILTLILGVTGIFMSLIGGNFLAAGIIFIVVILLMVLFPLIATLITRKKTVRINDKRRTGTNSQGDDVLDVKDVRKIASGYQYGVFLGKSARAIVNQADTVGEKINEARAAVDNRFAKESITWDRYMGVVDSAAETALDNLDMMARRISVLDEREYARIANPLRSLTHKEDTSDRLEFYQENKRLIDKGINDNEVMFNKLDKLALELGRDTDNGAKTDAVIQDIEDITNQVKYYN